MRAPGEAQSPAADRRLGILTGLVATLMWGTQFPISSELFPRVDPYVQSPLRYALATLLLALVVIAVEGTRSLRFDGQGLRAFVIGGIGVFGGVFIVYVGVQHSRPQDAALVVAFQPIITAIILRARGGPRIPRVTLASILIGLVGVLFVITHGHPTMLADGQVRWGLGLVLLGQVAWAYYTIEMTSFPGWSVLRVAALTAATGSAWMIVGMLVAWWVGLAHPSATGVWDERWRMAYMTVGPTMLSLLAWTRARSSLGAQNTALFINIVPITAFVYAIVQGYRPSAMEVLGVAIAIGALVANNLLTRSAWEPRSGVAARPAEGDA